MTSRARLYAVMVACFALGAVSIEAIHLLPSWFVAVAAVEAVAGFWAMYALATWYEAQD